MADLSFLLGTGVDDRGERLESPGETLVPWLGYGVEERGDMFCLGDVGSLEEHG